MHHPEMSSSADSVLKQRCERLATLLPDRLQGARVPGLSLAAASSRGVIWQHELGARDATGAPVESHTVFESVAQQARVCLRRSSARLGGRA